MCRINIFVGHFGSGKTELAINYALMQNSKSIKTAMVDIDIVNPYFCSRDVKDELEGLGIRVICSNPHLKNAELMVIPPEIKAVFNDKSYKVVFDVGGDDMGAIALSQFNSYFKEEPYNMYFVINTNRPLTSHKESIINYLKSIEAASRLKVTGLIANTNMCYETTIDDIIKGDKIVQQISKELGLPHVFTLCTEEFKKELEGKVKGQLFIINKYMKTPWD